MALIDVDRIGALGEAFKKVVESATVDVDDIDLFHGVQRCDRYRNPVMFDLLDVAERLKPDDDSLDGLNRALSDRVKRNSLNL